MPWATSRWGDWPLTAEILNPQTNGMVERLNGRISDLVKQTRFASAHELETTLTLYLHIAVFVDGMRYMRTQLSPG